MKDKENNKPSVEGIGVWNDPELEARLVAMLMGELSPFEEAEMQEELEKSPELRLFRDRITEVQGLISEVSEEEAPSDDEGEWKLSPDRREGLLETFANKEVVEEISNGAIKQDSNDSDQSNAEEGEINEIGFQLQWRSFIGVAACLLISMGTFLMMFVRRGDVYKNEEEIVSYSVGGELLEDVELVDEQESIKENGRLEPTFRSAKPSDPSSSMSKVIASNGSSLNAVPVPTESKVEPSLDFGNGEDFGLGWGGADSFTGVIKKSASADQSLAAREDKELNSDMEKLQEALTANVTNGGWKRNFSAFSDNEEAVNETLAKGLRFGDSSLASESANAISGDAFADAAQSDQWFKSGLSENTQNDNLTSGTRSGDFRIASGSLGYLQSSSSSDLLNKEVAGHESQMADSDKAILDGRRFYQEKNYDKAVEKYKEALEMLPPGEVAAERRRSYTGHLLDGSIALSTEHRRAGKYAEARELLGDVLETDPGNITAQKHLEYLDDPIRTSPTLTYEHVEDVEKVRKGLYRAKSYYDQAHFDEAYFAYNEVLKTDPYNKAARRGMENVDRAKMDYYRAAYDQTRAAMLREVDAAWEVETPVPNQDLLAKRKLQEEKVEDYRTRLYAMSKKYKIPYLGKNTRGLALNDSAASERSRSSHEYEKVKAEAESLEVFSQSLNGLSDAEKITALISSGRQESRVLAADYVKLNELKSKKNESLGKGANINEDEVKEIDADLKELENRLARSTKLIEKQLNKKKEMMKENLQNLSMDSQTEVSDLMLSAEEKTTFQKVREDYERELAVLEDLKNISSVSEGYSKSGKVRAPHTGEKLVADTTSEQPSLYHIDKMKHITLPITDFIEEISAADQTHSTFSLNVSDVSYQLVKAGLLEGGEMPNSEKIRVEEFVNAFDYGDPSVDTASGQKVNCVVEQVAHPFYQQRNLMRIGMKTGALGRSQPLRLTVLLDNSGSMERADRAATVYRAMETLAAQLGPQDEVTLLSFARDARMVAQKVKGNDAKKLAEIVKQIPAEGGTNLSLAIQQAYATAQQSVSDGTMSRVVLITDGAANLGNSDPEVLAQKIEQMRQSGIAFDACGIGGDGLDDEMLEALTRKGDGRYYFINKPEDTDKDFAQKLAGALRPAAQNVKVQVVFNPNRVGKYRLIGFEKHRLEKQDFRNDTVDAAEMAAEEAGNALYQIEAKPNGTGNVGTVFVRFRDVAFGQMVERSWTIPYQPNINNIYTAKPSMQLATLAGMLGEQLKYGDKSGVDYGQLKPLHGKLRSEFQSDDEVKDLIRMCEKVNR